MIDEPENSAEAAELSAAEGYGKGYESNSESDVDSDLDEDSVFSKLLGTCMRWV